MRISQAAERCVNGRYHSCTSACPETCFKNPGFCFGSCVPGCKCHHGYVLKERYGNICVKPKNCMKRIFG
ncbi:unnamed protein product [Medioppia subpectinata]|uniref:TIL domain-containing protein n=1 Tax=Medioppia subpectinata TaxID=1979941 RepID=A0A7R9PVH1_9ACAR|nr:unnamed protein product [Medioppia subpectinata]CAG2102293.1 unnamed protein product [Medioppia subpectinata]